MTYIQKWLDRTTMYKVVLYILGAWGVYALGLSLFGFLYFTPLMLGASLVALSVGAVGAHYALKEVWGAAAANIESTLITILILFFVLEPSDAVTDLVGMALVAAFAVTTKYVFAWKRLHLFNPAAIALVFASASAFGFATWWIGNSFFLIPVLIGGFLITEKIRRWELVLATVGVAFVAYVVSALTTTGLSSEILLAYLGGWPMYFFATVMVTEPLATPPGKKLQILYGGLIGLLSAVPFSFGIISSSYSLSLLIANAVFYPFTLRGRYTLTLSGVRLIAKDTYEYTFTSPVKLPYKAGQFLEWTVPHSGSDARGIRRYFTIASAPSEEEVLLGLKIPTERPSSYKQILRTFTPGDTLSVTALGGDFVLPKHPEEQPIVMIAGGIGVTPFRSHVADMFQQKVIVDATLFYFVNTEDELAWNDMWQQAASIGLNYVPVVQNPSATWSGATGRLSKEVLLAGVSDIAKARVYVSGPPGMVDAAKLLLKEMDVSRSNIVVDYFPGLA